ncbi:MAG: hypothetical protein QXI89_00145 [Candidatus Anstonellales archaeon]
MKAQASVESMAMLSLSLMIILSLSGIAFLLLGTLNENLEKQRALVFIDKLQTNSLSVYMQGQGASKKVLLYFPNEANITTNNTIVILNIKNSTIARDFGFNITIAQPSSSGYVEFIINNSGTSVGVYPQ